MNSNSFRIGGVAYLNALPLMPENSASVHLDHPSVLSKALAEGTLDAGLVPTYEWFLHPDYLAVDGIGIACRGPVYSVFLASHRSPDQLRKVYLDPASRTSYHLVQVLLHAYPQIEFCTRDDKMAPLPEDEGALFIGDHAIRFRQKFGDAYTYHDLGEWWIRETGLPFVFALWLIRPDTKNAEQLADYFRSIAKTGMERIPQIARQYSNFSSEFVTHYLTNCIHYRVCEEEKRGIEAYGRRLSDQGLIPHYTEQRRYI